MPDGTVTFNFNALTENFTAKTGRILERASLLLRAAEAATENLGFVPSVAEPMVPVRWAPRPVDEVRQEGAVWIAETAMRDCVEEVSWFFEEVHKVCAALMLMKDGPVPYERWEAGVLAPAVQFEKLNFPDKTSRLRSSFPVDVLDWRSDDIVTLVAARNCLVHRRGVVAQKDCTEPGKLVVRWRSMQIFFRQPDGTEEPFHAGMLLKGGGQALLKHGPFEKVFKVGESVTFTPSDLSEIWMTLHFFGVGTAKKVHQLGLALQAAAPKPVLPHQNSA